MTKPTRSNPMAEAEPVDDAGIERWAADARLGFVRPARGHYIKDATVVAKVQALIARIDAEVRARKAAESLADDAHEDLRQIRKFVGRPEGANDDWATGDLVEQTIAELRAELASRQGGNATAWAELRAERDALRGRLEAAMHAVGFFACCIKSGERWSEQCEEALRATKPSSEEADDAE